MAFLGHLTVRLVTIGLGLFIAMLAASLFLSFGMFSGMLAEFLADLQWAITGDPYMDPADASPIVTLLVVVIGFFTSFHVAALAALPIGIAIALAEAMRWRGLAINLVIGGLVALATGLSLYANRGGDGLPSDGTIVVLLAIGFIGAFFYWLVAGRSAGRWLDWPQPPASANRVR